MYKLKRKIVNVCQLIYFNSFIFIKDKHAQKNHCHLLIKKRELFNVKLPSSLKRDHTVL